MLMPTVPGVPRSRHVISRAGSDDFIDVLCGISISNQEPDGGETDQSDDWRKAHPFHAIKV